MATAIQMAEEDSSSPVDRRPVQMSILDFLLDGVSQGLGTLLKQDVSEVLPQLVLRMSVAEHVHQQLPLPRFFL